MGCTQSKIENEEAVSRCKDRKTFMKQAVAARNAFAAGHSSYAVALKNTGAALSDFAGGEVMINSHVSLSSVPGPTTTGGVGPTSHHQAPPPPPPIQTLPPPPPPIPDMPPQPLQRAISLPEFAVSKHSIPVSEPSTIEEGDEEEEEEEEEEEDEDRLRRRRGSKGGSVGGRIESSGNIGVVEAPPPPMPDDHRAPHPPMPDDQSNSWDYFFNVENFPGGSLGDVEDIRREEHDRKMFDEMPKRAPSVNVNANAEVGPRSSSERVVEEKVVMEKPSLGPANVQHQGQGGSGRGLKKGKQIAGQGPNGGGEMKRRTVNLVQIFTDLDDFFLKASESAHEVAKMLEAARLHYHSNFADDRGK